MFSEMEREGFYPPRFEAIGSATFQVTLRNGPVYDRPTFEWLRGFREMELSGDQKRLLAYARAHSGHFTSRDYQKLAGLDLYRASNSIQQLIRKGAARSTAKGSRIYEVVEPFRRLELPSDVERLLPVLSSAGSVRNEDVRASLDLGREAAKRLLGRLVTEGWLERVGSRRSARYVPGPRLV
jgi:predicted HTH transcriptional regulator